MNYVKISNFKTYFKSFPWILRKLTMTVLHCWKQLSSWPSGLPMPSDICAPFIHKSLLLRLQHVALRKEGWARSLKHVNVLLYSPTRHSTAHIHPCGSMSLVSLVTSSVLMTRTSNNLCRGERDFSSLTEWAQSSQRGKRKGQKNMYSWRENFNENLVLPPTRTSFHLILRS